MYLKTEVLIERDCETKIWKRAKGLGGAAISISGPGVQLNMHLYEGAMYSLYNALKLHIEQHGERPTAKNVVRLDATRGEEAP